MLVVDQEPPVDRLIVDRPRLLPPAHSAGGAAESARRAAIMTIEEILRVARGERPRRPVNDLG